MKADFKENLFFWNFLHFSTLATSCFMFIVSEQFDCKSAGCKYPDSSICDGTCVRKRDVNDGVRGDLISESFSIYLQSPKKCAKSLSILSYPSK